MPSSSDLSPTSYVILGMLGLGAQTGYEIKKTVDLSIRFFWAASHAQIYPELKRLESAGLIRGKNAPQGARARTVYTLQPSGKKALSDWLKDEGSLDFEFRDLALVKLFFADALSREQAKKLVATVRERHRKMLSQLETIDLAASEAADEGRHFPKLTLGYGLEFHRWVIDWCDRLEGDLG